ncbi:MAG: uroporphyrinogen decarboxylase [Magnetococcus sp. WYHC-3]
MSEGKNKMQAAKAVKTDNAFLNALNGKAHKRPPYWLMRQAGRYLPEYRQLRAQKGGFLEMAFDPLAACEITMQPLRRFGMDAAIIFSDILTVPMALGQHLEFQQGEGPKLGELDIAKLKFDNSKLAPVYEALGNVSTALHVEGFNDTALIGFAGAPWTVATYMVEGGSSRDFFKTKLMAMQNSEEFSALIDILVESTSSYLIEQANAGAEALQIFDSWAGVLDDAGFEKFSIAPIRRIVENVRAIHAHVPIIGFPRGATPGNCVKFAKHSGVTALGLGQDIAPDWAASNLQPLLPVQGNLDPTVLMAGGDILKSATKNIITALSGGPFVFNLGHGVHKDTPVEHVEQLVKIIRDFKP